MEKEALLTGSCVDADAQRLYLSGATQQRQEETPAYLSQPPPSWRLLAGHCLSRAEWLSTRAAPMRCGLNDVNPKAAAAAAAANNALELLTSGLGAGRH